MTHENLIGTTIGRLKILRLVSGKYVKAVCLCACGEEHTAVITDIIKGSTKSCGCLRVETTTNRMSVYKEQTRQSKICPLCGSKKYRYSKTCTECDGHRTSHGRSRSNTYKVWSAMIQRCENPSCKNYPRYGGRGIKVCERWKKFENFVSDVGECPAVGLTLDRFPDNNGNYEPGNIRWTTRIEQANNTRRNIFATYNGRTMSIAQWARELHVPERTLYGRHERGVWP